MSRARKAATLAELARICLEDQQARGVSAQGLSTARYGLQRFVSWCEHSGISKAPQLNRAGLTRYHLYLEQCRTKKGQALAAGTIRGQLSLVRVWCRWLSRHGYLHENPAADLELPRSGQRLPRNALNENEVEEVLEQADLDSLLGLRDRAIMEVLYSTALRCGELVRLDLYDIDRTRGLVTVRRGKGNKDRVVPIGQRALYWLDRYLVEVRPELIKEGDDGALFVGRYGPRLGRHRLSALTSQYVLSSGIGKTGGCHLFRHTAATQMLWHGAGTRDIQELLGHAKITTTQIYTHVAIAELKAVHARTHPAESPEKGTVSEASEQAKKQG